MAWILLFQAFLEKKEVIFCAFYSGRPGTEVWPTEFSDSILVVY